MSLINFADREYKATDLLRSSLRANTTYLSNEKSVVVMLMITCRELLPSL